MEALYVKGDDINPTINLNHQNNNFSIVGESRPENPLKYYDPVFKWFNDYFTSSGVSNGSQAARKLKIDLDYFNSTSAKVLFDLFTFLNTVGKEKHKVEFEVDWVYYAEDTDMLEAGKEMETMCGLKFNYHPKD